MQEVVRDLCINNAMSFCGVGSLPVPMSDLHVANQLHA